MGILQLHVLIVYCCFLQIKASNKGNLTVVKSSVEIGVDPNTKERDDVY